MNSYLFPQVKFCLIDDGIVKGKMPQQSEELATGYDVYNAGPDITLNPFEHKLIPLGFKTFIQEGWWLFLAPRSSTHAKKHMHTLYGVVDESYEGLWYFSAQYIPQKYSCFEGEDWFWSDAADLRRVYQDTLTIKHGDAIAQIIVMPRYQMGMEQINEDEYKELCALRGAKRGAGGFGAVGG